MMWNTRCMNLIIRHNLNLIFAVRIVVHRTRLSVYPPRISHCHRFSTKIQFAFYPYRKSVDAQVFSRILSPIIFSVWCIFLSSVVIISPFRVYRISPIIILNEAPWTRSSRPTKDKICNLIFYATFERISFTPHDLSIGAKAIKVVISGNFILGIPSPLMCSFTPRPYLTNDTVIIIIIQVFTVFASSRRYLSIGYWLLIIMVDYSGMLAR